MSSNVAGSGSFCLATRALPLGISPPWSLPPAAKATAPKAKTGKTLPPSAKAKAKALQLQHTEPHPARKRAPPAAEPANCGEGGGRPAAAGRRRLAAAAPAPDGGLHRFFPAVSKQEAAAEPPCETASQASDIVSVSAALRAAELTVSVSAVDAAVAQPASVAAALRPKAASAADLGGQASRPGLAWTAAQPESPGAGAVVQLTDFGSFPHADWLQYNGVYAARLAQLRSGVLQHAYAQWAQVVPPSAFKSTLTDYRDSAPGRCAVLLGVLCKDMKRRPSARERSRHGGHDQEPGSGGGATGSMCTDEDVLWLEDGSTRLQLLCHDKLKALLATGLVVAVLGHATPEGRLQLLDLCFAQVPAPLPRPPLSMQRDRRYVALTSGLAFGSGIDARDEAQGGVRAQRASAIRQCLVDFVVRAGQELGLLLICGGNFGVAPLCEEPRVGLAAAVKVADATFAALAACAEVHVMPGRDDPTNLSLPQLPLHSHLFPRARGAGKSRFRCVSNPYSCSVDGLQLLGHSGQPVQDLLRCTRHGRPVDALHACLHAMHLAPTAPDTLPAPPFNGVDPLVVGAAPHVLFSGGHNKAAWIWKATGSSPGASGTMCICVPALLLQPAVVIVSLDDPRQVHLSHFDLPAVSNGTERVGGILGRVTPSLENREEVMELVMQDQAESFAQTAEVASDGTPSRELHGIDDLEYPWELDPPTTPRRWETRRDQDGQTYSYAQFFRYYWNLDTWTRQDLDDYWETLPRINSAEEAAMSKEAVAEEAGDMASQAVGVHGDGIPKFDGVQQVDGGSIDSLHNLIVEAILCLHSDALDIMFLKRTLMAHPHQDNGVHESVKELADKLMLNNNATSEFVFQAIRHATALRHRCIRLRTEAEDRCIKKLCEQSSYVKFD